MTEPRPKHEQERLTKLESKTEHGRRVEVGIGEALAEIREPGLFKEKNRGKNAPNGATVSADRRQMMRAATATHASPRLWN